MPLSGYFTTTAFLPLCQLAVEVGIVRSNRIGRVRLRHDDNLTGRRVDLDPFDRLAGVLDAVNRTRHVAALVSYRVNPRTRLDDWGWGLAICLLRRSGETVDVNINLGGPFKTIALLVHLSQLRSNLT